MSDHTRCPALLPGTGWQCERDHHSRWDHHEANRIEWYDVPTPEERAERARQAPPRMTVIGHGWCQTCARSVTSVDGRCATCFGEVSSE